MAYLSPKLGGASTGVFCLETSDTSGYTVDWHAHDGDMLLLPRLGGLLLATESNPQAYLSNQSFSFVPAGFAHATQAAPGREKHMTLYVDPGYVRHQGQACGYRGFTRQLDRSGVWPASPALENILRLHDQLQHGTSPQAFAQQLPHLNQLLFTECARLIASQPAHARPRDHQQQALLVQDIQRYVRENLDRDLSVDAIGHEFHLSRRQLTRVFKAVSEQTLVEFINRARVESAAHLLSATSLSILDVSLAVGLQSPSYLARLFQRLLGVAPSELRRPG